MSGLAHGWMLLLAVALVGAASFASAQSAQPPVRKLGVMHPNDGAMGFIPKVAATRDVIVSARVRPR